MSEKLEREDKVYAFRTVSMWFVITMNLAYVGYEVFLFLDYSVLGITVEVWHTLASLTLIAILLNLRGIHRKDERFI